MDSAKTATLLNIISKEKKRMRIRPRKMIPRTRKLKLKNQARRIKKVITNLTFKNRKSYLTEIQKNAKVKTKGKKHPRKIIFKLDLKEEQVIKIKIRLASYSLWINKVKKIIDLDRL
jgi:hypothetical protein